MKIFISTLFLGCLLIAGVAGAEARVSRAKAKAAAGCKSTITLPNGLFIYKNSAPLRSGGVGTPLVGYRVEPTLIMNRGFSRGRISVHASNGTQIGSCPWSSAHGAAGGRARCTMNTRSLRSAARRAGGSPSGFFKVSSTVCVVVPDFGKCYGSVKGLCNRTLS